MMTTRTLARHAAGTRPSIPGILNVLFQWGHLRKQRIDLARLDDKALEDIGVTYEEARKESRKPFWMMPNFR